MASRRGGPLLAVALSCVVVACGGSGESRQDRIDSLVYAGAGTGIVVVDQHGGDKKQLTRRWPPHATRVFDLDPTWSPDASLIAFVRSDSPISPVSGWIHVIAADGSANRRLARGSRPRWSPAGKVLLITRGSRIYALKANGSGMRFITRGHDPAWSPDGKSFAFVRGGWYQTADGESGPANPRLYVRPLTGAAVEVSRIDGEDQQFVEPVFSPDGTRIAYTAFSQHGDGVNEIHVVQLSDGSVTAVEAGPAASASWTPDGNRLLVADGDGAEVVSVKPDGSDREVHVAGFMAFRAAWSPDVQQIAFGSPSPLVVKDVGKDGQRLHVLARGGSTELTFEWRPAQP